MPAALADAAVALLDGPAVPAAVLPRGALEEPLGAAVLAAGLGGDPAGGDEAPGDVGARRALVGILPLRLRGQTSKAHPVPHRL